MDALATPDAALRAESSRKPAQLSVPAMSGV
jgi:hypothetical protein